MTGAVRFVAILGTRDDVQLIEAAIAHLRRIGVDLIIISDGGSIDGTLEVIAQEEAGGDVWLFHVPPGLAPIPLRTEKGIALARSVGAEWVLFLDPDEFVLPATGSLSDLPELAENDILTIERFDVAVSRGQVDPVRGPIDPPAYGDLLLYAGPADPDPYPKVMARPEAIVRLHEGDHRAEPDPSRSWRHRIADDVLIAHLQFSTMARFERKVANIRHLYQTSPGFFEQGQAFHWLEWVHLADQGRLAEVYESNVVDDDRLAQLRTSGEVRSAAELLATRRHWRTPEAPSGP